MEQTLPWIVALVAVAVLAPAVVWFALRPRVAKSTPLPAEWNLSARPVFSTDERRVYRQLREALPHHIVLSKLPLVRFCQPTDPQEVRFWYELLGASMSRSPCAAPTAVCWQRSISTPIVATRGA
jgi:hypothetical protein